MSEKFKKINKEFLLTDSTLNSYSYRLLTSGYDLAAFKKNPIGYYMHGTEEFPREMGVLVKWEDLRAEGDNVYGKPCINLTHPRGPRTVDEIESGFLNAASVGHIVALGISYKPEDYLPDQKGPTVSKWFNREASLVDVPGNYNALTDLVDENDMPLNLADFNIQKIHMKQIFINPAQLALMNLKADAEQSAVDAALTDLVAKAGKVDGLEKDLNAEKLKVTGLETQINAANEKAVTDLLAQAVKETRCTQEFANLIATSHKGKVEDVKAIIATMKPYAPIVSQLNAGDDTNVGKTWEELDREGKLEDLKAKNPGAFKALFKQRFNAEYTGA
ncbi:MAG: hypothetical protein QM768_21775 [Agriterribacter sp.]